MGAEKVHQGAAAQRIDDEHVGRGRAASMGARWVPRESFSISEPVIVRSAFSTFSACAMLLTRD
jgi:hypothetical protein